MKTIRLMTYHSGCNLPPLPGEVFPHSHKLFRIYEQTPGYTPILIVASIDDRPVAKLLSVVRRSVRYFPPSIIKRCEVYGTGEYFDESLNKEELFGHMLEHLTKEALNQAFLIEFRNLSSGLFGYKHFKRNHYFPINWLRIYNSLHSLPPVERLAPSHRRKINKAIQRGASIQIAQGEEEATRFLRMLKKNYSTKIRKHFPDLQLFHLLTKPTLDKETAKIFLVKYKGKTIGGSFCIFSDNNAYLCFSAGLKKTYSWLHPNLLAIWAGITYAKENGYQHFEFADTGLPFKQSGYRQFILNFGGKQISTRRWFRFRWTWLNRLIGWFYR
ncbi:MAG: GNAT family N-acetyltransferase [Parabacteroides sp.]|nr:GNAT family N-acetyltransferase [Parabacteroides sp.]